MKFSTCLKYVENFSIFFLIFKILSEKRHFQNSGQGHSHYEFKKDAQICVEVSNIESSVQVAWQNGERSKHLSTDLVPGNG